MMAACLRLASTAVHSRTRLPSLVKAATTARSAPVAAIRWPVAQRGPAILAGLSLHPWSYLRDTLAHCDGGWAATTAVPVRAGESTLSRDFAKGHRLGQNHTHPPPRRQN